MQGFLIFQRVQKRTAFYICTLHSIQKGEEMKTGFSGKLKSTANFNYTSSQTTAPNHQLSKNQLWKQRGKCDFWGNKLTIPITIHYHYHYRHDIGIFRDGINIFRTPLTPLVLEWTVFIYC